MEEISMVVICDAIALFVVGFDRRRQGLSDMVHHSKWNMIVTEHRYNTLKLKDS